MAITIDELLHAMEEANAEASGDGFTVSEIVAHSGMSQETVRNMVRAAIVRGEMRPAKKRVPDMAGRLLYVPSYVPVTKPKANAAKRP